MTLRDEVWDEVLFVLSSKGKFKISDLKFDKSQRHTVRRVLRQMENQGWLNRETEQAGIWRLGSRAEILLDVNDEVIEKSKE